MKQCPKCSKQYADEAGFCLQDGTPLVFAVAPNADAPNTFAPVSTPFQPWSQQPSQQQFQPPFQQAEVQQAQAPPNVGAPNVGAVNVGAADASGGGQLKNPKKVYQTAASVLLVVLVLLWVSGSGHSGLLYGILLIEMILAGLIFSAAKS